MADSIDNLYYRVDEEECDMLKNYILQYLRDEISYRTERCIKVFNEEDQIKKFAEFKAFIFSIGSAMDLVRVRIFNEFPTKNRFKSFSDFGKNGLSQDFENFVEKKFVTNFHNVKKEDITFPIDKIIKIFFAKKFVEKKKILDVNGKNGEKKFTLWEIYNSLKHSTIIKDKEIYFVMTDSIIGRSEEFIVETFDKKEKCYYYISFPGKPVAPEGIKPEDCDISSESETLIWIKKISKKIIEFLNSLDKILEKHK